MLRQVRKNDPKISNQYAVRLSSIIVLKSRKYHVSSRLLAAILMQESTYHLAAEHRACHVDSCRVVDFGIGQINYKTIRSFHMDRKRLVTDLTYSVDASARVLASMRKSHPRDPMFWTRYNASSFGKRQTYARLVYRYM